MISRVVSNFLYKILTKLIFFKISTKLSLPQSQNRHFHSSSLHFTPPPPLAPSKSKLYIGCCCSGSAPVTVPGNPTLDTCFSGQ